MVPDGGAGHDLQQPFAATVPAIHLEASPARPGIGEALSQRWLTPADDAGTTDRAGAAVRRRIEQPGIETQAGDHADPMSHGVEQVDGSEAAIGHRDDLSLRKPSCDLQHDLPAPVGELLMPLPVFARVSFRRCQDSQEWQSPDASGPGDLGQQHDREPP